MSKKLINSPDSCVEDLIHGLLYANPMLTQVQGCNALVHSSIETLREEQVTLISGGGSGHEPAHAGYIGNGCIHGAVLGHVFASPSVQSIYNTIRVAAGSKGIILVVKNYTGDRLNFGMALEKAKQEGVHGKMIIVDDDCALPPGKGITGGRGIAGTVLVHKICGALAANGHSVDHIFDFMQIILPNIRTMGVALSMCHLPSQIHHPSNRLAGERAIEIGMGIHGEQGREQAQLPQSNAAKYIASVMVESVLTRLGLNNDDEDAEDDREVVVLLNNLGCLPALEMGIVVKEVTEKLLEHSCRPVRIYSGSFMTSLDMNGVSLSILNLSLLGIEMRELVLSCLDHPTNAPAWIPAFPIPSSSKDHFDVTKRTIQPVLKERASEITASTAHVVESLRVNVDILNVVRLVCNRIIAVEPQLSEYDAVCGDGDCGTVMKKGASAVLALCDQIQVDNGIAIPQFLDQVADTVSASMGGTSGVLLEICFRAMSSHFSSKTSGQEDLSKLWIGSLAAGVDAIRYYGGADVGMRTMLDALVPAVESLKSGRSIEVSAQAASAGVEATKTMQSLAGRSNYVAQEKMQGIPDPGAFAMAAAFEALVGHL